MILSEGETGVWHKVAMIAGRHSSPIEARQENPARVDLQRDSAQVA